MDENIRLEDEKLFFVGLGVGTKIKRLNEKGIFTVADFINADVTTLSEFKNCKIFMIYQEILKYKYRGQKMIRDVYLEKKYHRPEDCGFLTSAVSKRMHDINEQNIYKELKELGFFYQDKKCVLGKEIYFWDGISMMEAIEQINDFVSKNPKYSEYKALCDFYFDYYEKELKEKNDLEYLDELKTQIVELVKQKAALDKDISQLVEKVNFIEEGCNKSARK